MGHSILLTAVSEMYLVSDVCFALLCLAINVEITSYECELLIGFLWRGERLWPDKERKICDGW